jgi:hypothetical protein
MTKESKIDTEEKEGEEGGAKKEEGRMISTKSSEYLCYTILYSSIVTILDAMLFLFASFIASCKRK